MEKISRAIILAAGEGKRMRPLTLETPKPLVYVNGTRMIDTVIIGLLENGIEDIYLVVGYMKEAFLELTEHYTNVKLIENPYYKDCNNISSLYVARDHLANAMILDGDQMILEPGVLSPLFERSGYNAVWCDDVTDEWLLKVEDGVIQSCSRTGGKRGWQLYSISRWSEDDGERLKRHLEIEFEENAHRNIYWDDVPLFCFPGQYRLGVMEMNKCDVVEIDTLEELAEIDAAYKGWLEAKPCMR